jgi:magnesium chelatase family protein
MAEQVKEARDYASWRRARDDGKPDERRNVPELRLDGSAGATLDGMAKRLGLGGRNIVRIARVACTIADLDGSAEVQKDHVMEACAFRTRATL